MDGRSTQHLASVERSQWLALFVTCLGTLVMALDTTIVNIALPAIRAELGFAESSLVWVVNAYMVPCGGLLVLCGRLGDHYGHRRTFLIGIAVFTLGSCGCGVSQSEGFLIGARVVQGMGAAAVLAVTFPLIMRQFDDAGGRARALAIYSCVASCGSSAGLLLGGTLISWLSWRWVFLINLPVGALIFGLRRVLSVELDQRRRHCRLDIGGAITITTSLTCAICSILNAVYLGWGSSWVLLLLCGAFLAFLLFISIESRVQAPIFPLTLFTHRNLRAGAIAFALWAGAQNGWFFISALNLADVLGHDSLKVGLAFLPATVFAGAFSLGLSARLVARFGTKLPTTGGLLCAALGLTLLAQAPVDTLFLRDMLPGMLLLGLGAGIATAPLALGALSQVSETDYGVASGAVNTSRIMGAALGLALMASVAAARSNRLIETGANVTVALNGGYSLAYAVGAGFAAIAALAGLYIDE